VTGLGYLFSREHPSPIVHPLPLAENHPELRRKLHQAPHLRSLVFLHHLRTEHYPARRRHTLLEPDRIWVQFRVQL
jgi:hypothetical protein